MAISIKRSSFIACLDYAVGSSAEICLRSFYGFVTVYYFVYSHNTYMFLNTCKDK